MIVLIVNVMNMVTPPEGGFFMAKNSMINERSQILDNLIGQSKIQRIQTQIHPENGGLINYEPNPTREQWINSQFGKFGVKILAFSNNAEQLNQNDITVIGGWCAIRTADLLLMQQGILSDPLTGRRKQFKTPQEVAEWTTRAVSIDQITEAIGIYKGTQYAAISEEQLWTERVQNTVGRTLDRQLTEHEKTKLDESLHIAEQKRFLFTNRYVTYVRQKDISITRVVDKDIYNGLISVRDEMLDCAGVTLDQLLSKFPDEKTTRGYSIVWGMYTGPYLALLKNRGYVPSQKGLIVEPWWHATSETRTKKFVNQRIFSNPNNQYLSPNGLNSDLGFVAFADTLAQNGGQRIREAISINACPNPENYRHFIDALSKNPEIMSLSLGNNPAFIWGANFLPFGTCAESLRVMIQIKNQWKQEKELLQRNSIEERIGKTESLKKKYQAFLGIEAIKVIAELDRMLQFVFEAKK